MSTHVAHAPRSASRLSTGTTFRKRSPARFGAAVALFAVLVAGSRAQALVWPDVVERVERDLTAPDAATRRAAARELVALGAARGGPLVLAALNDADDDVRVVAAEAAIRLRVVPATDVAVTWLNGTSARLRYEACEVARALPNVAAIAPLARTLGDADANVRAAAADALGHQKSPDAVPPLLGHLDEPVPLVRVTIVDALARLDDRRAVVPLVSKVEDSSPDVRRAVVRALGDLGDVHAASALILTLRDQDADVRREALVSLGRLRAADAVDAIAPFATDRSAPLRTAALDTLGRLGTPDALRALVELLGTGDDAAPSQGPTPLRNALASSGASVVPVLHAVLVGSPSTAAAAGAAWVLGKLHARSEAHTLVDAMRRGVLLPADALHALAGAGTSSEIPVVLEFVTDESPAVRREAIDAALALLDPRQPDGRAVEPLAEALRDRRPSTEQRARLAEALGRTGAPRAAHLLSELVSARDRRLRLAAIDALGELGSGDADDALTSALSSPDDATRVHAATTLSEAGGVRARDALLAMIDGGDDVDRISTLTALGGMLARLPTNAAVDRLVSNLDLAAGAERDALIDAFGRSPLPSAIRALGRVARSDEPLDRREAAVVCAAHGDGPTRPDARAVLRSLAADPDASVRAQAAWSLGSVGDASDVDLLARIARASDDAAAADATAALGRIAAGTRAPNGGAGAAPVLCALARDPRPFVRANAFAGAALADLECLPRDAVRAALADDPSDDVRAAAARLLAVRPNADDARALDRCARLDVSGSVAARCASTLDGASTRRHAVLVYVVPQGPAAPRVGMPYAMLMADGLLRVGTTDRRGAVLDPVAPEGTVGLTSVSGGARRP